MKRSLSDDELGRYLAPLQTTLEDRQERSASGHDRPLHLMIGGAHRFKATTAARMGQIALGTMRAYGEDFVSFAKGMGLPASDFLPADPGAISALESRLEALSARAEVADLIIPADDENAWLAYTVHRQVLAKLESEAVESYRIDFEDGYGVHPDEREDADASMAARETTAGMTGGSLPSEIGIRLKAFEAPSLQRAVRTLDIYVTTLLAETAGRLPPGFVVTMAKVSEPEQVALLARLLAALEDIQQLPPGIMKIEIMIETPEAMFRHDGRLAIRGLVEAAAGRCSSVHFGAYDYTAGLGITAAHQGIGHPFADSARHLLKLALAGSEVGLTDSPVMALPIGPHRADPGEKLTEEQKSENREVVHRAWRRCFKEIQNGLRQGFYQGWDLHPNQLPVRYAANYTFFREQLAANSRRMKNFVEAATGATRVGAVFDDPATVRALLTYFRRAFDCGAITRSEVEATGLTAERLRRERFEEVFAP